LTLLDLRFEGLVLADSSGFEGPARTAAPGWPSFSNTKPVSVARMPNLAVESPWPSSALAASQAARSSYACDREVTPCAKARTKINTKAGH
jgi:hypothetical protein